jgi:hypothetical protein
MTEWMVGVEVKEKVEVVKVFEVVWFGEWMVLQIHARCTVASCQARRQEGGAVGAVELRCRKGRLRATVIGERGGKRAESNWNIAPADGKS